MSAVLPLQEPAHAPLGAIAKTFLTVSVFGFGGGIVWTRRIAVEQRGWLSDAELLDIVSLCQFLPGSNIIGIAVCTGAKLRGAPGALAAVAGFLDHMSAWGRGDPSHSMQVSRVALDGRCRASCIGEGLGGSYQV